MKNLLKIINILCHRGLWKYKEDHNSLISLEKAIKYNFGVELDIRDHESKIIISHDTFDKKIISEDAKVGLYYWKKVKEFASNAERMIKKNIRVNSEFYVCPVYNEAILNNKKIIISKIEEMQVLGTTEDLDEFIRNNKK